jgi:integrase
LAIARAKRAKAGRYRSTWTCKGRWHDAPHTFVTNLAALPEVSDETIRQLAGHVSKGMLERYSHIRMAAKRAAAATQEVKPKQGPALGISNEPAKVELLN